MTPVLAELGRSAKSVLDAVDFAEDCGFRPGVMAGTAELVRDAIVTFEHCLRAIQDAAATDRGGMERQRSRTDRTAPGNHG
jgi:hypothetical protein